MARRDGTSARIHVELPASAVEAVQTALAADEAERPTTWVSLLPADGQVFTGSGRIDAVTLDETDPAKFTIGLDRLVQTFQEDTGAISVPGRKVRKFFANYIHRGHDKSAGEILALEVRDNTLWAQVFWTLAAAAEIAAGEWNYTSFEMRWSAPDNLGDATQDRGPHFKGFALTNDPAFVGQTPVSLDATDLDEAVVAAIDLGDGTLDEWLDGLKDAVRLHAGLGFFGGTRSEWTWLPKEGVTEAEVTVEIEVCGSPPELWLADYTRNEAGEFELSNPRKAKRVVVEDTSAQQDPEPAPVGAAGGGMPTKEELQAEVDRLTADLAKAQENTLAVEGADVSAVRTQLDTVLASNTELKATVEAQAADITSLTERAKTADEQALASRLTLSGVPESLKGAAKLTFAQGGHEALDAELTAWGEGGLLVPVGRNSRQSDGGAPPADEGGGEDMHAKATAKLDEIVQREGVAGVQDAGRILAADHPELARYTGFRTLVREEA